MTKWKHEEIVKRLLKQRELHEMLTNSEYYTISLILSYYLGSRRSKLFSTFDCIKIFGKNSRIKILHIKDYWNTSEATYTLFSSTGIKFGTISLKKIED